MKVYRIAERNIAISSLHEEVHRLCADYLCREEQIDFSVVTRQSDIDFERERSARTAQKEGRAGGSWSDAYLETLAVYRRIAEKMPDYDTFLFHGSCAAVDGQGYLFTAPSGTGKSTHVRLWRELLGERVLMINDDKPLIRLTDAGPLVCGTPWDGKHHLSTNASVPLKAVCLLERAPENSIRQISFSQAFPRLLQQAYRPEDRKGMQRTLALLERLSSSVCFWQLSCNMDLQAAVTSYEAMKG